MANELTITTQGDDLTIYVIIRRHSDAKVWDAANTTWATWVDGNIDDYDIPLTAKDGDLYQGDFPTDIAAGTRVRTLYYYQEGASPATGDPPLRSLDVTWDGAGASGGSSVTLDSTALSTLNGVKRHLRLTNTSAYDTILTELINAISAKVKRIAGRDIIATDYVEWYSGRSEEELVLHNWPLIYVNGVYSGEQDAIKIKFTGTAIRAIVQVADDRVRLTTTTAAGTTTNTDKTFASFATASLLATEINDNVAGWSATLVNDTLTKYLHKAGGRDAKGVEVSLTWADELVTDYRVDKVTGTIGLHSFQDYPFGDAAGTGWIGGRWNTVGVPAGHRNVMVDYRAGYETVPADVDQLVRELVQQAFGIGKANGAFQSESLGSYSYSLADQATLTDGQLAMLAPYRREAVA